jgi:predicted DNA-binding transcriptional regulator
MAETQKVIFSDTRKTRKITLPSFEGSEVEIFTELNIGQQRAIMNADNDFDRGLAAAEVAIKGWNLYEDETTPLATTAENLKKFPIGDVEAIFAAIIGKSVEEIRQMAKDGNVSEVVKKNTATA